MLETILAQLTEGHIPLYFAVSSDDNPESLCVSQATALLGQMGPLALNFLSNYLLFAILNPWSLCVCVWREEGIKKWCNADSSGAYCCFHTAGAAGGGLYRSPVPPAK
ncbi:hypothetical protein ILYODFUR_031325 [Ilyodon furcidens]|uniref:Uncharacterized protein n=1 Tax=Ilyodon furcidens TaxID=33524 RepID=A0ABV0TZ97_9TELE